MVTVACRTPGGATTGRAASPLALATTGPNSSGPTFARTALPAGAFTASLVVPKSGNRASSTRASGPVSRQTATSAICGNRVRGGT